MSEIWNLSAICRCCHSDGKFKSLNHTYVVKNDVEIYSSMLRDTFGINIDPPKADISYTICDKCIDDLRRATQFKKQVIICEAKFEEYCKNEEYDLCNEIKVEISSSNGNSDREDIYDDSLKDNKVYIKDEIQHLKREEGETYEPEKKVEAKPKTRINKRNGTIKKTSKLNRNQLKLIIKSEHGDYTCTICTAKFDNEKSIKNHITTNHRQYLKCDVCDLKFENRKEKTVHMATHKGALMCTYCGKTYSTSNNLIIHLNSHTKKNIYRCDYCNKDFLHKRSLRNHILVMHLGKSIRKIMCDICGHSFNDVTNMRYHVQTVHQKLKPFKCTFCMKGFTAKKHVVIHERRKHTGETPFECDQCEKAYPCAQDLKMHKFRKHSDSDPTFRCKLCNTEFESKIELSKHYKSHAGSKPLSCHLCSKGFSCKYSLRRHVESHIGVAKKYKCDICLREFAQKASMIRHKERIHSAKVVIKKPCSLCKRQVADLEKHLEVHNNKPFNCEYCSKSYPKGNALRRHIDSIHFGRKPHACDLCDQKYVRLKTLVKHKLKVHKVEN